MDRLSLVLECEPQTAIPHGRLLSFITYIIQLVSPAYFGCMPTHCPLTLSPLTHNSDMFPVPFTFSPPPRGMTEL